ncbi:DUF3857 domain-containing transglutaminase family protein [Methylomonas sp. MED-D]|uniref:DUF3857 domain-containing transglutaminase family protein n=1 Tax=unclassified Methylomonas TaxID=2608980 RepID=UPI0028A472DA|nr:DUF3857 domain-containing transglutaminase family protein [Methylomonas sp. MV1]MDT4329553.1 DUF3857 domain-containing transglutaminase family protein [Methylomonas sp. MV1]
MNKALGLLLMLGWALACAAGGTESKLRQIGYSADLLRCLKTARHSSYRELAPTPDRVQALESAGYGSVALSEEHQFKLLKNGQVEETVTETWLYLTSSAIENDGNVGFWFDAASQRAEIQAAYVLQPEGVSTDVEPDLLQINTDNSPNIFNDSLFVTIPLTPLKPGSIAVLRYKIVTASKKVPLPWSRNLFSAYFYPVERFQVDVSWDSDARKPTWRTDDSNLACHEETAALHCATLGAVAPLPYDQQMPAPQDLLPVLTLAEPDDWPAISARIRTLTDSALAKDQRLDAEIGRLSNGVANPRQLFKRVAAFVARDIRYVGLEHGHGGVIPRPTSATLERRFGDCKDKAMLFVDLARRAGLDAYPVLTSTKRRALNKLLLPSSSYFNHMIACVNFGKDQEQCTDLTDPETAGSRLPHTLHGAVALTVGQDGAAPRNLPSEPFTWVASVKAENRLTEAGSVVETLVRRYESHWAAGLRRVLAAKSKAESERWLLEDFRAVMGDQVAPSVSVQGLETSEAGIALNSVTEYPNLFTLGQLTSYQESDSWLRDLANDAKTSNRHYPYRFEGIDYRSELSFRVPAGRRVASGGPKIDYVSAWGELHRHVSQDGEVVTAYTRLEMPKAEIPVAKIAEYNRFLELVGYESRFRFSLSGGSQQ